MKHGVFGSADVEIDRHPVLFLLRIHEDLGILRVDVSEVVPARSSPLGHGVCLSLGRAAALWALAVHPAVDVGQRALACAGGLVALDFGKFKRKFLFGNQDGSAVRAVDEGDGLSPVSLAAEDPVAQLEVDHLVADLALLEEFNHLGDGVGLVQSVQETAVDVDSVFGPGLLLYIDFGLEDFDDGQVELLGEFPVAGIVCGDCHDGARAVGDEDIVCNPDGDFLAVDGVDGIASGEDAGFLLCKVRAVEIALLGCLVNVVPDGLLVFLGGELGHERMLGRNYHVGGAEEGVASGREDLELAVGIVLKALDLEENRCAFGLADPIALHELDALGPVQTLEVVQKSLGVGCNLQDPLADVLLFNLVAAAFAFAVLDLFVGKSGLAVGAPVDRGLAFIGKAFLIEFLEYPLCPVVVLGVAG